MYKNGVSPAPVHNFVPVAGGPCAGGMGIAPGLDCGQTPNGQGGRQGA